LTARDFVGQCRRLGKRNTARKTMLRAGQKLGKYKIERRIAEGGFASIYRAFDTIEGIRVALKVPHRHLMNRQMLEDFRREVRLAARLDHPNILPIKDASMIDGKFVVVFPLGDCSLDERMSRRMSLRTALDFAEQILSAVAFAHKHRIVHCDIKPENLILFDSRRLRLTDFGVAKVARRTISASGSGTLGYIAPEQAMGKPSQRSDVFSVGLILYRLFSGHLPEWPYDWPPAGYEKLRRRLHPDMIALIRRAIEPQPRKRFRDADVMLQAFRRAKVRTLRSGTANRRKRARTSETQDWQQVRRRQFLRRYGRALQTHFQCARCGWPVSEPMQYCPWCGARRRKHRGETNYPARCPRCGRGRKLDWRFCPWCWARGFRRVSARRYTDVRYDAKCSNPSCRGPLMPYMRYCPWCHRSVKRKWKIPAERGRCRACGWGVVEDFWSYCPWCGRKLERH